jgi:hypothetical protein
MVVSCVRMSNMERLTLEDGRNDDADVNLEEPTVSNSCSCQCS